MIPYPTTAPPVTKTGVRSAGRTPTVSIVIPAYNEEDTIERCLNAAIAQSSPAREIIVVDNRSTDSTSAIARRIAGQHPDARIRVLEQFDEQGIVPTRNAGFAVATGDVLGRIDADTAIAPQWVSRVAAAMTDPTLGAVSGPVSYYDLPFHGPRRLSDDLARRVLRRLGRGYPFLFGSNMAIRATAWATIKDTACLDHADLLHEDIDLAVHLHDAGIAVGYQRRMRAAISARRLASSPESFRSYTGRFERTYAAHGVDQWHLKAPQLLLQNLYRWTRVLRSVTPASWTAVAA